MRLPGVSVALAVAAALVVPGAHAMQASAPTDRVELKVVYGGKLLGTPSLEVPVGSSAATPGEKVKGGYSLDVSVARGASPSARTVDVELYLFKRRDWVMVGHADVALELGDTKKIDFVTVDGTSVDIDVTVRSAAEKPSSAPS
jgi:hypothetical protein